MAAFAKEWRSTKGTLFVRTRGKRPVPLMTLGEATQASSIQRTRWDTGLEVFEALLNTPLLVFVVPVVRPTAQSMDCLLHFVPFSSSSSSSFFFFPVGDG